MVLERHPMDSMGVSMVFNGSQPLANDPLNPMVERPPMKWQWILERQPLDSMKWQWISWATIGDEPLYWSLFFFKFLSDTSPIIDLPCQSVSHLFTVLFDKQPIHAIFYRIVPSQTYAEDKVFWRLWSYVLMPEQNKSHVIDAENKTKAVLFGAGTKQKSCWWCRNKIKAICHGGKKWSAQFSRYFRPV